MAISRVPGFSLLSNLDRQGVDLQITTQGNALAYMDFTNFRFGINTSTPSESLTVNGNILVSNGHVYPSANISYDLGLPDNYWRNVYTNNAIISNDLTVGGILTIDGNVFTSNITGNIISAEEIYENGYRVLTANSTLTVNGDLTGSGNYSNIYLTLNNSGVSSGVYGSTQFVPQIEINSKGIVVSAANIVLTQVGNLLVSDTELYTAAGNISIAPAGGNISVNNSRITNLSTPINNTDSATKQYVDSSISAAGRRISIGDSEVSIYDDSISPAWVTTVVDGTQVANITVSTTQIYNTLQLNTIAISGNTISATGNIILEPAYPNIVKLYGNSAVQIPAGDDQDRPDSPVEGYIRYNTARNGIEFWDGAQWQIPGEVSIISDIFTPDGVSNVFILTANTSTQGVLVSINGTVQRPQSAYTVTNNAITFTEVPLTTDIIEVRTLATGAALSSDTLGYDNSLIVADGVNLTVTGNLIPSANITYSLGSSAYQWKDLWVSNNTIYLGGNPITVVNGQLSVNGNIVGAADPYGNINVKAYADTMAYTNYSNVNVAAYLGGSFSVGTITDGTWSADTIAVNRGGTGATTSSDALNNLLPSGEQTGYVLKTSGPGSYYWSSESGGGGATVGQELTTIRQSNVAVAGQTVFDLVGGAEYTPGAGQLRVYIDGVRQFPDAYTETSANSYTLSSGVSSGAVVFAEIDQFSSFNNYANLTYASNIGNITAVGLTVQSAIEELETTKAPIADPVFTGNVSAENFVGDITATNITGSLTTASQPNITGLGTITTGTWSADTIALNKGGTGATTTSGVGGALDNLLPSGEQTGYVLATNGAGSYFWTNPSTGGATVGQQLTTLRQANTIVSNTTVINLAGISYTPGSGQLRVYVNGVRQFPDAYVETSNVRYTLTANVVAGDSVFTEIDQFSSFNNFANLTIASNIGNIAAAGLTVQSAINSLETNKAPLASPVFTGTATATNLTINGLTTLAETTETLDTKSSVTGTVVHDFSTTAIWYYSSISGNVTANFTNIPTTNNRITSVSIVINQGGTGYIVNGLQIDGAAQTIRWQANTVPTASTNRVDVFTFSLLRAANAWTVLGSATSHG